MRRVLGVAVLVMVLGAWTCAPVDDGREPMAGPTTAGLAALQAGEDWHPVGGAGEPAFQNSWVDGAETVAFRLRESGIVDIKGSVTGGTPGSTIFTLPEGYRPVLASSYVVFGQIGGVPSVGLLTIETSGNVHGERFSATDHDAMYITGSFFLNVV